MIFGLHGEALFAKIEGRPSRNGPGLQDTVTLEPEVIMQSPGRMLLDDEEQRSGSRLEYRGRRLGRGAEGPLGRVLAERRGRVRARLARALAS
jgi:hypothetical protein